MRVSFPRLLPKDILWVFPILTILGLGVLLRPALSAEFSYQVTKPTNPTSQVPESGVDPLIIPADSNFGIKIPKIGADSKVMANVNPFDKREYERYLKLGVAHAAGSALPSEPGNVFIFAHSTATLWESREYNAVFYLLGKLSPGDRVYLSFNRDIFTYVVKESKVVGPGEVSYLKKGDGKKTLTLMTCWPLGLDIRRLIVSADFLERLPL